MIVGVGMDYVVFLISCYYEYVWFGEYFECVVQWVMMFVGKVIVVFVVMVGIIFFGMRFVKFGVFLMVGLVLVIGIVVLFLVVVILLFVILVLVLLCGWVVLCGECMVIFWWWVGM